MDSFICGTCHLEFNDFQKFSEHKQERSFQCGICRILFHAESEVQTHINDVHVVGSTSVTICEDSAKAADFDPNVECVVTCREQISRSMEINNIYEAVDMCTENVITEEPIVTMDHLNDTSLISCSDGNLNFLNQLKILSSIDSHSDVISLTNVNEENESKNRLPISVNGNKSHDCQSNIFDTSDGLSRLSCPEPLLLEDNADNKINDSPEQVSVDFMRDISQIDGIYACAFCQCFAISKSDVINHIRAAHQQSVDSENTDIQQFATRLEPVSASSTNTLVQENTVSTTQMERCKDVWSSRAIATKRTKSADSIQDVLCTADKDAASDTEPKKKRGRPKKSDQKRLNAPASKPLTVNHASSRSELPAVLGPDNMYHCQHCKRSFRKHSQFLRHKCMGCGDYIALAAKEAHMSAPISGSVSLNEELDEDEEEMELDTDATKDFKLYMPTCSSSNKNSRFKGGGKNASPRVRRSSDFDFQNSSVKKNLSQNNSSNTDGRAITVFVKPADVSTIDSPVEELSNDNDKQDEQNVLSCNSKSKVNWRRDPAHVPVFSKEEDKLAFEKRLNDIDLQCVEHLFTRHDIACDAISRNSGNVARDSNELSVYLCKVCKKVFKSLSHVTLHCLIHTDFKPFTCTYCSYCTNAKGNLYTHMRKHTGNFFCCSHCGFQCNSKGHLMEHEATHSKIRHQCKLCKRDYNTIKSLMNHVRKYHDSPNGRKYLATFLSKSQQKVVIFYSCHVCNHKFKKQIDRDRHIFIHKVAENPNALCCTLCNYTTSRKSYLDAHHQKHRLVYVCCVCCSMFLSSIKLKDHLREHLSATSMQRNDGLLLNEINKMQQQTDDDTKEISLSDSLELLQSSDVIVDDSTTSDCTSSHSHVIPSVQDSTCDENLLSNIIIDIPLKKQTVCFSSIDNNSSLLLNKNQENADLEDSLKSLYDASINQSWYLPEPDGTMAFNQYVNIPEELVDHQVIEKQQVSQNEIEELKMDVINKGNMEKNFQQESEFKQPSALDTIVALNYKPLTSDIYKKIKDSFGESECDSCGRLFHGRLDLESHKLKHVEEKPFKCDKCSYSAGTKEKLKEHHGNIHEGRTYQCEKCDFVAASRASLWYHNQKHFPSPMCEICDKKFANLRNLRDHIICVHPNISKDKLSKMLGSNRRPIGRLGRRSYKCPYCSRIFHRSSADLQKHIWIHEGIKPYKCDQCTYSCRSPNNLKAHKLTHTNEKPFQCIDCKKRFKSKATLQSHFKTHNPPNISSEDCNVQMPDANCQQKDLQNPNPSQLYMCKSCVFSSGDSELVKAHYQHVHVTKTDTDLASVNNTHLPSDISSTEIVKLNVFYKCTSCSCILKTAQDAKEHLKVNHGILLDNLEVKDKVISDLGSVSKPINPTANDFLPQELFQGSSIISTQVMQNADSMKTTNCTNLDILEPQPKILNGEEKEFPISLANGVQLNSLKYKNPSNISLNTFLNIGSNMLVVQKRGQNVMLKDLNTQNQFILQYMTEPSPSNPSNCIPAEVNFFDPNTKIVTETDASINMEFSNDAK